MPLPRPIRIVLALGIGLGYLLLLVFILFVTQIAFQVWEQFQEAPAILFYAYLGFLLLLALVAAGLVWRLLVPRPKSAPPSDEGAVPDHATLLKRVDAAEAEGVAVDAARHELQRWAERRAGGTVYVCLFGEVSTGKSSLIQALLPAANTEICVIGGTTLAAGHYRWESPAGDFLVLTDMPGLNQANGEQDQQVRDEALHAHAVIYLCDGDLTRSQSDELQALVKLGKPCILVLNKIDRYTPTEHQQIRERLVGHLPEGADVEVVSIRSGGSETVFRQYPDGREESIERPLAPDLDELKQSLQRIIDRDMTTLESLRDSSVFVLTTAKLDVAVADHRRGQAQDIVSRYSRRAVIGAMAAVTPGTDILIQGYLGMSMTKELCTLYGVPARKVDTEVLLDLVQKHVGKTFTLLLAVAGNGLKAFPGVGTLAGGILHAVAYGMIFDTLGRAVATTLDSRGELHPALAAVEFKEGLGENLGTSARRFAKLALAESRALGGEKRTD